MSSFKSSRNIQKKECGQTDPFRITKSRKRLTQQLDFIRRNLKICPTDCRKTAYISLVRSVMEYGSIIWDPYLTCDIEKLERVQRQAACFITGDYHSREEGSVTKKLETLELETLERRRSSCRLVFLFKVVEGLVPAISPDEFLKPQKSKRQIKPKKFTGYKSTNIIEKHSLNNDRGFIIEQCKREQLNNSFFHKNSCRVEPSRGSGRACRDSRGLQNPPYSSRLTLSLCATP